MLKKIVKVTLAFLIGGIMTLSSAPIEASSNDSTDAINNINTDDVEVILNYVENDDEGYSLVNIDALKKNEKPSQDILNIAYEFNKLYFEDKGSGLSSADSFATLRAIGPTYGNWCGYKHTHADRNHPAIDILDAFCKNHDLCYRDRGNGNRTCDRNFARDLKSLINSPSLQVGIGYYGKVYMRAAYAYFSTR